MNKLTVDWIYILEDQVVYPSGNQFSGNYLFYDRAKKEKKLRMAITREGRIYIKKGYAWDGCTPKFCLLDLYVGTPDGAVHQDTVRPKTYYASLFHDALYQFCRKGAPYQRCDADNIFYEIMRIYEFAPRYIYYAAVRLCGGAVKNILKVKRKLQGEIEKVADNDKRLLEILNTQSKDISQLPK